MIQIRQEDAQDYWAIEALFDLCFSAARQGLSSYQLRRNTSQIQELCYVMTDEFDASLIAAIRYWPVLIGKNEARALLLGPIAVHPTHQGEGLGQILISETLEYAREFGWERVILIGDLAYYRRLGFQIAQNIRFPPPTNPQRILIKELKEGAFSGLSGRVRGLSETKA